MNKRFLSLLIVIAAIAGAMIFQATRTASSLVLLPSDLIQKGPETSLQRIRVGGKVVAEGLQYELQPEIVLNFMVEDPKDPKGSVPVIYKGLKPDMFAPGRDVIIDGDFRGGTIHAAKLLTQCPSKYEPPVPGASDSNQVPYPAGDPQ